MPSDEYLRMSVRELVDALGSHAEPGSMRNEEIRGALQVKLVEESAKPTRRANLALAVSAVSAVASVAAAVVAALNS